MDKSNLSSKNKGYKYLLNVIDLFTKYVYSIPLKSKSQHVVAEAFEKLFVSNKPDKLWTDQGSEFIKTLKNFLNDHNIELYHVHNEGKACVIERFNKTLGEMIEKHLTATNSKNYIDKLQHLIDEYNNKNIHSTIKMTPLQATDPNNVELVSFNTHKKDCINIEKPKFDVGDRVRIYSYKTKFDKGFI